MSVVDTNVLVHAHAASAPDHARAFRALARLTAAGPVAITRQIMREFLAVSTRPQTWTRAEPLADAIEATEALSRRFTVLEDGLHVWAQLLALSKSFEFGGKQVHDANIVATMMAHGETRLLTFNTADFRRFHDHIELVEP